MMNKLTFLLFFYLLFISPLFAQYSTKNKSAIKKYEEANALLQARQNYDKAIELLEAALEKDPNFIEAHLSLAGTYKKLINNEQAKIHFIKAAELKPNSKEMAGIYYNVGEYYFKDGDYDKAKIYLDKVNSVGATDKRLLSNTKLLLEKVDYGVEAKKNPVEFKPELMPKTINKFYLAAYPVLTADEDFLIFMKRDGPKQSDDEDIMISQKVNGEWTNPTSISENINSQFNEGTCTMSADGRILVFTSCSRPDGFGLCDLYISTKVGDSWSEPVNLGPNVNSTAWDSEPSLSADGRVLYFSSERKGGMGGMDIWYTEKDENGEWQMAKNLGKDINTRGKDVGPFIHANGVTLYFSSDTHPGMGGLDIFYSKFDGLSWSAPKNVGYPINTQIDDATIYITPDQKKGIYAPYGLKGSLPQLYQFEVPKELKDSVASTYAKGHVYDAETKKMLGANIELIDLKTNKTIQSVKSDSKNGDYLIVLTEGKEYAMYIQAEGYLFKSVFFDFKNPKAFNPLALDVYLEPIKVGKAVVLNNIFFPSNNWKLEDKSKTELEKIALFMRKNPKVNLEFGGHTDDVGSDKDNLELSKKRAQSVYDYMVSKGIYSGRLKYQGYGETKPIVPNTNEENRQVNRRIEFKIL